MINVSQPYCRFFLFLTLLLGIVLLVNPLSAQVFEKSISFGVGTPYLEPDARREGLKISATEFVVLVKAKGGLAGESGYLFEKYDKNLNQKFTVPITIGADEDIMDLFYNGSEVIIFSVIHDINASTSKLMAYGHDPSTGNRKWDKTLHQFKVKPWAAINYKGAVKQTFENAICSNLAKNFVTPLEYQYKIEYSPKKEKILIYIYDYGQKNLIAEAILFDKSLNKIKAGIVPIDNNFVNYGVYPNESGEVFILNVDKLGRIVVIQYDMESKVSKLLDLQYASSNRESLKLRILSDNIVYVGNINTNNHKLIGVMYSKFDFNTMLIEKINFHDISDGIMQTAKHSRELMKGVAPEESWLNFELTHFFVNEYEKVIMVLEKRELSSLNFNFDPSAAEDIKLWVEKPVKVNTEGVVLLSFNGNDELMWENFYMKSQINDVTAGMISSSYKFTVSDEGKLRMIYSSSDNVTGIYNLISYVEWDELTGTRVKDIHLQNDEGVGLMRNYTFWWEDKLILAGRKGLMGKKCFMNSYKLD